MAYSRISVRLMSAALCAALLGTAGCSTISGSSAQPEVSQATVSASQTPQSIPTETERCKVDPELSSMQLETKIGQLLTVGVADYEDALNAINTFKVGGIFIGSEIAESMLKSGQVTELGKQASLRPLIAIDEEGGRVSRIASIVGPLPSARQMAATMTPDQVKDLARQRGQELHRLGITVDFAPSLDVSDQPDDSVIGDRSFSNDPDKVVAYGRAFAEGLLEAGVTPVFKHFPGHGHSSGDSHLQHVTVPPVDQLGPDLRPFAELISMPGTAVMVGHMEVPGLTAPGESASLSPATYQMLRTGQGFGGAPYNGAIFTDDLSGMRAITDRYSVPDAVLQSLIAGADSPLWISTAELPATIAAVRSAVEDGRLTVSRLDESLRRLIELRSSHGCGE